MLIFGRPKLGKLQKIGGELADGSGYSSTWTTLESKIWTHSESNDSGHSLNGMTLWVRTGRSKTVETKWKIALNECEIRAKMIGQSPNWRRNLEEFETFWEY